MSSGGLTLLGAGSSPVYGWSAAVAALGPYAWWRLDEDNNPPATNAAADASGNARPGLYNGDATNPSRRQAGPNLEGESTAYAVTSAASRNIRDNSLTVATLMAASWSIGHWVKGTSTAARNLCRKVAAYDSFAVWVNYNPGTGAANSGHWAVYNDSAGADVNAVSADINWNDGNWNLVGYGYDQPNDLIFINMNGVTQVSASPGGTVGAPDGQTEWLYLTTSNAAGLSLAHYLFFDRVVTEAEWAGLYSMLS